MESFLLQLASCTEDGASLHGCDLRECDTETATTMTEHWVVLCQRIHTLLDFLYAYAHFLSHGLLTCQIVRYELVERWVEQADVHVATIHSLEDAVEVSLLIWEELGKCFFTTLHRICQNHLAHRNNLLIIKEHVLCTCQSDTLGTECTSYLSIMWSICIGTDFHLGIFIAEIHQFLEVTRKLCSLCLNLTSINLTCSTIQRDEITLLVNYTFDFNGLSLIIYIDRASTRYTALTHTTSNHGSVGSHTTTSGKNTLSSRHTSEVFRRSLDTNHDDLLAILMPFLSIVCVEYDLTTSSTRRSRKTLCDDLSLRERQLIEYRVQQFIKFLWLTTEDSSLLVDHTLVKKIHSNLHHRSTCTLTVTSLEEPEFTFLYGELHILHIMIVVLQLILQRIQFLVKFRHSLFHRRIFSNTLLLRDTCTLSPALRTNLSNLLWRTDTSHYVLTLCIDEILTIEEILAITSIAREANTSS